MGGRKFGSRRQRTPDNALQLFVFVASCLSNQFAHPINATVEELFVQRRIWLCRHPRAHRFYGHVQIVVVEIQEQFLKYAVPNPVLGQHRGQIAGRLVI